MRKGLFLSLVASMFFMAGVAKADVDPVKATQFVKDVTAQGIEDIINANVSQAEKDKRFAKLFSEALDLDFIGQFVLGRNWKAATDSQKAEFIKTYRELNVKTWSKRFDEFKGKAFIFEDTTPSKSKGQIFVNSVVPMNQQEPAKVVWRVKETDGKYQVVDIIIENVSLAITARNEYSAFIKNNSGGIDALIEDLKNKIKQTDSTAAK
ncbi:MAG: ABC transporter substrate-binding protein [Lactobacillus sp.]|jgi:phospholipid transport system substrate-binding protein|nr:ABC transporter substrate-binding protein [Lactobacillus sp.]